MSASCVGVRLLSLLLVALLVARSQQQNLTLSIAADGSYLIQDSSSVLLRSGPTELHVKGAWFTSEDKSLVLGSPTHTTGEDSWGSYYLTTLPWKAGSVPFITSFYEYRDLNTIVFEQSFPNGGDDTQVSPSANNDVMSSFPSFQTATTVPLRYHTYYGNMGAPFTGTFTNITAAPLVLNSVMGGSPLLLSANDSRSILLSSAMNFMVGTQQLSPRHNAKVLSCGLLGMILSVPQGFKHQTILHYNFGAGAAFSTWGQLLRTRYNKTAATRTSDIGIETLSYWTDNGAYYYYQTEPNSTYAETMVDAYNYIKSLNVPVRNWQFDSWWYFKAPSSGLQLWEPRPDVFPNGMEPVDAAIGHLPLTLHNRWFDPKNTYVTSLGFRDSFVVEETCAVPVKADVFVYLMGKAKQWGLTIYEQDWLITTYTNMKATQSTVDVARNWLLAMGDAAQQLNLTIQYCMPLGLHLLQSLEVPVVTQARASDDYQPGNSQWKIGYNSLLLWSLGLVPFKDNFWTTSVQPNCPYLKTGLNCTEPNPELQTLVAALSYGPVASGDMIGGLNVTRLMQTTAADGTLLKPDQPAVPIDSSFLFSFNGAPMLAEVWYTYSQQNIKGSVYRWTYVLAAALPADFNLCSTDVGSSLPLTVYNWHNRSISGQISPSQCLTFSGNASALANSKVAFDYVVLVPTLPGTKWLLIGETSKFVTMSAQRFTSVSYANDLISANFQGTPGEVVSLTFWNVAPFTVACTIPQSGSSSASCSQNSCSCGQ